MFEIFDRAINVFFNFWIGLISALNLILFPVLLIDILLTQPGDILSYACLSFFLCGFAFSLCWVYALWIKFWLRKNLSLADDEKISLGIGFGREDYQSYLGLWIGVSGRAKEIIKSHGDIYSFRTLDMVERIQRNQERHFVFFWATFILMCVTWSLYLALK